MEKLQENKTSEINGLVSSLGKIQQNFWPRFASPRYLEFPLPWGTKLQNFMVKFPGKINPLLPPQKNPVYTKEIN